MPERANRHHGKSLRVFLSPQKISPHLHCGICMEVFEQPRRLLCGHTFCHTCIQLEYNYSKKTQCPECGADYRKRRLEKDLFACKFIDSLRVRCGHAGCGWQGVNSVAGKHQRECKFKPRRVGEDLGDRDLVVLDDEAGNQGKEAKQEADPLPCIVEQVNYQPQFEDSSQNGSLYLFE